MEFIKVAINNALKELDLPIVSFNVDHPKDEANGDYSSNVAMILAKQVDDNPRTLAQKIGEKIQLSESIEKVEVAGPGFINFYLKQSYLVDVAAKAIDVDFGRNTSLAKQKTYVEFTDPNPFKEFHIGHLMSNTIGESLCRILEANGATVKRACYQGDVGLHVAKSIWGLMAKMKNDEMSPAKLKGQTLKERVAYLGAAYAQGAGEYEVNETAKTEMNSMNKAIYDRSDRNINELYDEGRKWSLEYFETIYERLGTKFEEYFFESEAGEVGLKVIEEGLEKGVLELGESEAVVFKGEKYGLHTRVFRNKLGLPTYEGKELGLAKTKAERWAYDKSFIITANEIDEYFKVLIKALTLLYPELGAKTVHLSHGMMKLTTGKMSSRTGKVVTGEGLLNELKEVVLKKMGDRDIANREVVADQVAVASLKYSVLKQAIGGDIVYEPEKMTNLEGDTGPYLQYTYARTQSVLAKSKSNNGSLENLELNPEEVRIVKWIYRYPEVVSEAGEKFAPQMISGYIFELAQRFNSFYSQHQIVGNETRIFLTKITANILKNGLNLLGIKAPKEM